MSELKVIDVDRMADVRSLSGQFYRRDLIKDCPQKKVTYEIVKECNNGLI